MKYISFAITLLFLASNVCLAQLSSWDYIDRALEKMDKGNLAGAIRDCDKAIELDFNNASAYNSRGYAKDLMGDLNGALRDYNKAIELNPDFALIYVNRAIIKAQKGDPDGVIRDCDKAIELDPDFAAAYANRAAAKAQKGDFGSAVRDSDKAIELDPGFDNAYNIRGAAKFEKGDTGGAIIDYDKAIELNPNHVGALYNRGKLNYKRGKYHETIRDMDSILEIAPQYSRALSLKKDALSQMGEIPLVAAMKIQLQLKTLGYDPGPIDGVIGRKVTAALKAFQEDYEITPDGKLSEVVRNRLNIVVNNKGGILFDEEMFISVDDLKQEYNWDGGGISGATVNPIPVGLRTYTTGWADNFITYSGHLRFGNMEIQGDFAVSADGFRFNSGCKLKVGQ